MSVFSDIPCRSASAVSCSWSAGGIRTLSLPLMSGVQAGDANTWAARFGRPYANGVAAGSTVDPDALPGSQGHVRDRAHDEPEIRTRAAMARCGTVSVTTAWGVVPQVEVHTRIVPYVVSEVKVEVDTVSDIEREYDDSIYVDECPECNTPTTFHGLDPAPHCPHGFERRLPVEYVPARNLRGAVAALRCEWEMNHDERCTNMRDCASFGGAKRCHHPRPDALRGL